MKTTLYVALLLAAGLNATYAADAPSLSAWRSGASKQAIEKWVSEATQPGKNFIPVSQRYVVFDNDGTLWPEAPLTFQLQFMIDEIKRLAPQHPEWQQDPLVNAAIDNDLKKVMQGGKKGLMQLLTLTHSNITTDEFAQRVSNWVATQRHPRFGCRYDQLGYQPMRQLLDYLRANGFKTWIVSGGGIDFMRVLAEKMYDIPPEQVIGSFSLSAFSLSQNGTQMVKTMNGAFYDDEAAKPVAIHLFMGHRPVAAFGNSDGDVPMLQYTSGNPAVKAFGLLVHHTDSVREYAYDVHPPASGKLVNGLSLALRYGWTVVDTAKEWKTIFDPALCAYAGPESRQEKAN
ncbi:HAD family hydrolase [Pantoea sp. FN060301]|uniref:HAD family hydrolase n=1 Tax=Pantoea sp. FN060301 TaxID=3420380 RepID=UPI003D17B83B